MTAPRTAATLDAIHLDELRASPTLGGDFPRLAISGRDRSPQALLGWLDRNLAQVRSSLTRSGAIVLRGFDVDDPETFARIATLVGGPLESQYLGTSPRRDLAPGVRTASELPASYVIPEHSEMSFLPQPPRYLFFWCRQPAAVGGATTLVDGRRVLAKLDRDLTRSIKQEGLWIRRRHARPVGLHDPLELKRWPEMFGTTRRDEVVARTRQLGFSARFEDDGSLTLEHKQPAVRWHPESGERVWLNHLLPFHASTPARSLGSAARNERDPRAAALSLVALAYRHAMPRLHREVASDVRLGNGEPIKDATVEHVQRVIDEEAVHHVWHHGDVVLIDNLLVLHGRRPYRGPREIAVAWSEARR